ncbi:MAG: sugar phosphate nucleotidyltransferase, partial [Candidatus Limnocylindria bacterium]
MKGVVLAGGTGSRLFPLTLVTNKHLLPVYDRPMIFHPLAVLTAMGIDEAMVIVGG